MTSSKKKWVWRHDDNNQYVFHRNGEKEKKRSRLVGKQKGAKAGTSMKSKLAIVFYSLSLETKPFWYISGLVRDVHFLVWTADWTLGFVRAHLF